MDKKRPWHDNDNEGLSRPRKQQKTFYHEYTIAWICALWLEMSAATAMLDEKHAQLPLRDGDTNCYTLGKIKQHNVVIACLPDGEYGTNNAANVMANLTRTFPKIRACLMVGIGGGAPCMADLRLGDVVVGSRVMQYDLGKVIRDGDLQRTAMFKIPPTQLRTAVTALRAKHDSDKSRIPNILKKRFGENSDYCRPSSSDRLFSSAYEHISEAPNDHECEACDQSQLVLRSKRETDDPHIHHGAMASGNQVMRSASRRDKIARELDVVCFEMEAAGLMGNFPCLPIRGICDYADSHKSKAWQKYAAAAAAAYATELLDVLPGDPSHTEQNHLPDNAAHTSHLGHSSSNDHRQQLLESLKFDQIDSRQTSIKSAHHKTCRWFLKSAEYNAWLKPEMLAEHHGLLWIRGKPGAGKSTIMKYLYMNMSRTRGRQTPIACFFFHARGDNLERSLEGMYRSLLLQLLCGYPGLQSVLDDLVSQDGASCPSLNTLKDTFRKAVLQLGQRHFTCFIDALDECDEQQIMDMVDYFEDLTAETTEASIELHICFSSRHYPYVHTKRGIKVTLEDQQGHTEDLANYVESRLRIPGQELKEELRLKIIEKASGVFLWVVLVVDVLNKDYVKGGTALKKRLAEMPSGLHNLFKDMLRRDNTGRDQFLLCMLWILCAKRPLRPKEFRHAMWSDPSLKDLNDDELPEVSTSDASDHIEACVIGTSKGLAEITKTTKTSQPTVQFIHESVRDFLLRSGGLQELWPGLGYDWKFPSHERLKTCCYAYLNHPLVCETTKQLISDENARPTAENLEKLPFLEYASQHVLHHADVAAEGIAQYEFLSSMSLPDWTHVVNCYEKRNTRKYTINVHPLYILADRGCSSLIREWMRHHSPDIVVPKERYQRPLFAALAHGHKSSAAALLGLNSTIHDGEDLLHGLHLRRNFERYVNRTPLTWAAQEGRSGIVKILLQTGADVSQRDGHDRTALSRACQHGRHEVAALLLHEGADVNQVSANESPLSWAAKIGDETLAKLLIENGALPETPGSRYQPLFYASEEGHEGLVRLLLSEGAEPNKAFFISISPLMMASRNGHKEIARILLDNGAAIDATNDNGWSSLFWATRFVHTHMVEFLLEKGANLGIKCHKGEFAGQTPLSYALIHGHALTAWLLIQGGANLEDSLMGNPVTGQAALAGAQREATVETTISLIAMGLSIQPDCREQLLFAAIRLKNEVASRRLIESGLDVNARDAGGSTLLCTAIREQDETVVGLLLENGADIELQNHRNESPLFEALGCGFEGIAKLLVRSGANVDFLRERVVELPSRAVLDFGDIEWPSPVSSSVGSLEQL